MKIKNILKVTLFSLALSLSLTSCNDWLNLLPDNEQVTEDYWKSKEDVESVVASGYYYMRQAVPTLINWGELRGADFYNLGASDASKLQDFDMLSSNSLCNYLSIYQVISMANSVLKYAPEVQDKDNTYYTSMMQSHLCEAYFQRAWAYTILVKNYKEVPLIVDAYVNDNAEMKLPKASESQIIAQIKSDVEAALATGAAKGTYEEDWQTKSRATKWALYALMADICLWNHEYDECITYANKILEATDAIRPAFITETANWFEIFYPGLSNESIFELYWDYNTEGINNNFTSIFPALGETVISIGSGRGYCNLTEAAKEKMIQETTDVFAYAKSKDIELTPDQRIGRMYLTSYISNSASWNGSSFTCGNSMSIWKYRGTDIVDATTVRTHTDANFILYRVADVMLMKAEALVMKGQSSWMAAVQIINQIRNRAGLSDFIDSNDVDAINALDQYTLLTEVFDQREMEFLGEAHRWYDILRLARYDATFAPEGTVEDNSSLAYETYKTAGFGEDVVAYKTKAIELIASYNQTTSPMQLQSVLQNSWAWYMPLPEYDITTNSNLKQNPYYE
ncbi:MAG: RagB/SusD family nutrient uptake outer membrane protein [Bacteroidales bacterium]|nr:RagB/SusD family nutrient uptake outer membrane protein [Bacteroidales bacterium]